MATEPETNDSPKKEAPRELEPEPIPAREERVAGNSATDEERRAFLMKAGSVVLGGVMVAIPGGAAVNAVVQPIFEKGGSGVKVRLTSLAALPKGGAPQTFKVTAKTKRDAWTTYKDLDLGQVYLRHTEEGEVQAFNATCPHLGCTVTFMAEKKGYYCPCHESLFSVDGGRVGETPAERDLDTLDAEVTDGEVWVTFLNFKPGIKEKVPV